MKKIIRQWFSIILVVLVCVMAATPTMAASSKYKAAVSNYRRYIRTESGRYMIVDIDGNGIPELLAHTSWRNEIYTYNPKTRKRVCIGTIAYGKGYNMPIKYSKKCHTVMISNANTGGSISDIYKINGVKSKRVVRAESFNGRFENGCKINGKKVSSSVYDKMIRKYMKKSINFNVK